MPRRSYSDKERANALAVLDSCGGNISEASRTTGVPRMTLQDWSGSAVHEDVTELRQEKKRDLGEAIEAEVYAILGILPEKRSEASFKDLSTAAGIFFDKLQLLKGEPTVINQEQTLSDADLIAAAKSCLNGVNQEIEAKSKKPKSTGLHRKDNAPVRGRKSPRGNSRGA